MAHLQFAEETDSHQLDARKDEDTGDDEDGTVKRHDVLAGHDFQYQKPCPRGPCRSPRPASR